MKTKSRAGLEHLAEALDDAPIDDADVTATVARLGVDIGGLARRLRQTVAAADTRDRAARFEGAKRAYDAELERFERRPVALDAARDERLATFRALLARAPRDATAVHFHKYESASDEELAELTRALRHLLGDDDPV